MIRLILSKCWIPNIRNIVKDSIHSFRVCTIHKTKLQTQLMGDLPYARSTFSRPFTHTEPFDIKSYVGRGVGVRFYCSSTRAIHLEATPDLSTEKFPAAFLGFSARRGCPHHILTTKKRLLEPPRPYPRTSLKPRGL